jgi:hypothetical protein
MNDDHDDEENNDLLDLDVPPRDAHLADIRQRLVDLLSEAHEEALERGGGDDDFYLDAAGRLELDHLMAELEAYKEGLDN